MKGLFCFPNRLVFMSPATEAMGQAEAAEKYVEKRGLLQTDQEFRTANETWARENGNTDVLDGYTATVTQGGSFTEAIAQALYEMDFSELQQDGVQDVLNIWIRAERSGLLTAKAEPGDKIKVIYDPKDPANFKMTLEFTPVGGTPVLIDLLAPSPAQLEALDASRKSRLALPVLSALEEAKNTSSIDAAMNALGLETGFAARTAYLKENEECVDAINAKLTSGKIDFNNVEGTYKGTRAQNLAFLDWVITNAESVAATEIIGSLVAPQVLLPPEPTPPPLVVEEPVATETEKSAKELKEEMDALHDKIYESLNVLGIFRSLTVDIKKTERKPAGYSAEVHATLATSNATPNEDGTVPNDQILSIRINPAEVVSTAEGDRTTRTERLDARIRTYERLDGVLTQVGEAFKEIHKVSKDAQNRGDVMGYGEGALQAIFDRHVAPGTITVGSMLTRTDAPLVVETASDSPDARLTARLTSQLLAITAPDGMLAEIPRSYPDVESSSCSKDGDDTIIIGLRSTNFTNPVKIRVEINPAVAAIQEPQVGFNEATYSNGHLLATSSTLSSSISIENLPTGVTIPSGTDLDGVLRIVAASMQERENVRMGEEPNEDLDDTPLGTETMTEGERAAQAKLDSSWEEFTKTGGLFETIKTDNPTFQISVERNDTSNILTFQIAKADRVVTIQVVPNMTAFAVEGDGFAGYFEPSGDLITVRRSIRLNGDTVTMPDSSVLPSGSTFSQGIRGIISTWDRDLAAETARLSPPEAASTIPGKKVETLSATGSSIVDLTGMTNVSQDDFQREAVDASSGGKTVIVEFVNGSTEPTQGSAELRAWANATPGITVVRINSTATAVSTGYDLSSFPAFVVFKNGQQVTTGAVHSIDEAKR